MSRAGVNQSARCSAEKFGSFHVEPKANAHNAITVAAILFCRLWSVADVVVLNVLKQISASYVRERARFKLFLDSRTRR